MNHIVSLDRWRMIRDEGGFFQFHEITPFKNCEVTLSAPQKQLHNLSLLVAAVAGPRTTAAASVSEATPQLNNFGQYQRSVERTICNLIFCHMESFNWFVSNSSLNSNYTFRRFIKSLVFVLSFHQCTDVQIFRWGTRNRPRCCAMKTLLRSASQAGSAKRF